MENWYRISQNQQMELGLFDSEEEFENKTQDKIVVEQELEAPEKTEKPDIAYIGLFDQFFVEFRIKDKYWLYQMSFEELANKTRYIALKRSHAKGLNFAKQKAIAEYEVTKDYPMPGSIIRKNKLK